MSGTDIPLCGRITALADVYDALTTRRVYKDKMSHEEARAVIIAGSGSHFDPDIVKAFLKREADMINVGRTLDKALGVPPLDVSVANVDLPGAARAFSYSPLPIYPTPTAT
jgi:putative two-component system response regulator